MVKHSIRVGAGVVVGLTTATVGSALGPLGTEFEFRFAHLPRAARAAHEPWSGFRWPHFTGGVAMRWNGNGLGDGGRFPTLAEVRRMSSETLEQLSPAEKLDLLRGDYGYTVARHEWAKRLRPSSGWLSMQRAWARAAIAYPRPHEVILSNGDGIEVPFAVTDVKALLTLAQAQMATDIGLQPFPCDDLEAEGTVVNCSSVEAANFHVGVANAIGLLRMAVGVDLKEGDSVRYFPMAGYESSVIERKAGPGRTGRAAQVVQVETEVFYVGEVEPTAQSSFGFKLRGAWSNRREVLRLRYTLELDGSGKIIGGRWLSSPSSVPDRIWIPRVQSLKHLTSPEVGDLSGIERVLRASRSSD